MSRPDISYVISNYNSADFLIGLLDDLLNGQSHKNIEVIVVDSASTDDSVQCVREHHDERLSLIAQPERTPYGVSWLVGWHAARGRVVGNSNTDDRSYPWRSTKVYEEHGKARSASDLNFFYYGGYETWRGGACIAKGLPPAYSVEDMSQFFRCGVHVHWDNSIGACADWDRMFKAGHEYQSAFDYWLVLYFISLGAIGRTIPSCFSVYNQRPDSVEQSNKERNVFESMRAIHEFYPDGQSARDLENKTRVESPDFYARYQEFLGSFV